MAKVLFITTSAATIKLRDGTSHTTGFWAEELATAHRLLTEAGHSVVIATPAGKSAPVDPISLEAEMVGGQEKTEELQNYLAEIQDQLDHPSWLSEMEASSFDAIVIPGGHGPMVDLSQDADTRRILIEANRSGKTVGALCHGPAALLSADDEQGRNEFRGRSVAVFSDDEERSGGLGEATPYLTATRLAEVGLLIHNGEPWENHVVISENLITGQNPQSSQKFTKAVLKNLGDG